MPYTPRIAIVGAGPSGLAIAALLQAQSIHPTIAAPCGMLDLHEDSGLKVIRAAGLWDAFQAELGGCSEECRVLSPAAETLHTDQGQLSSRPEIARNALTKLLLGAVAPGSVKWGHKVSSLHSARTDTGATEVTLDLGADGKATYDFVVGADGAWSRVRTMLTDVVPVYTGAQYVNATLRDATAKFPQLVDLVGSGTTMALGGGRGIMTHRGPQDSIRLYIAVKTPLENWAKEIGIAGKTTTEAKEVLLGEGGEFEKWAPELRELLSMACDEETRDHPGTAVDVLPLYMLPVGSRWETQVGATLVGDAAHLMTPWGGEGVNQALLDSLELSDVLGGVGQVEGVVEWQERLEAPMKGFEEAMVERTKDVAEKSSRNGEMMLGEHGGQAIADIFKMFADIAANGGEFPEGFL
jgi:2-polyprenyl-6-methoxyphenol hydroxylase-like FAD-dependent oxidoreductase